MSVSVRLDTLEMNLTAQVSIYRQDYFYMFML